MGLPQTMFYKGYKVVQSTNFHVSIYDRDGKRVFHAQCEREFGGEELMEIVDFCKGLNPKN